MAKSALEEAMSWASGEESFVEPEVKATVPAADTPLVRGPTPRPKPPEPVPRAPETIPARDFEPIPDERFQRKDEPPPPAPEEPGWKAEEPKLVVTDIGRKPTLHFVFHAVGNHVLYAQPQIMRELREHAQAWLSEQSTWGDLQILRGEIRTMKEAIGVLEEQMIPLRAEKAGLEAKPTSRMVDVLVVLDGRISEISAKLAKHRTLLERMESQAAQRLVALQVGMDVECQEEFHRMALRNKDRIEQVLETILEKVGDDLSRLAVLKSRDLWSPLNHFSMHTTGRRMIPSMVNQLNQLLEESPEDTDAD